MNRFAKRLTFQVKDLGITTDAAGQEFGQIEAYGAMIGNIDEDNDRIHAGAFKRTIKSAKDRAVAREKPWLAPMLWQHDTHELIGGWSDIVEDAQGLKSTGSIALATQRGREFYALAKAGMIDQFSIIYDIPQGGAKYAKDGVRDLTELRLFSIDPVTFAANDATNVIDVKSTTPPPGGRGLAMNRRRKTRQPAQQTKTFQEHFAEEQCEDLLEDWQDVVLCALTASVLDAFTIGDQPESDIKAALTAFGEAVMRWVAQGQEYGLSDYLAENTESYSGAEYTMQYGADARPNYGYMSRRTPSSKAGRAISASNAEKIQGIADTLTKAADDHLKATKAHAAAVRSAADDLATVLQGSEAAYGTDAGNPDGNQEGKSLGTPSSTTRTPQPSPSPQRDTVTDDDVTAALAKLRALRVA